MILKKKKKNSRVIYGWCARMLSVKKRWKIYARFQIFIYLFVTIFIIYFFFYTGINQNCTSVRVFIEIRFSEREKEKDQQFIS